MTITGLIFVTGHMVRAGIYNFLPPLSISYTLCPQQVPQMAMALYLH